MNSHILVIDDEAPIREMLKLGLERRGYRVSEASSAIDAKRVVREDAPQLVISDLQLEDSDGLELVGQLKEQFPNVPVLLLTGVYFDAAVVDAALGSKVSAYLHKTASLEKIVSEVTRLLGG
jgi:DNA-binding NtrC family response regulator